MSAELDALQHEAVAVDAENVPVAVDPLPAEQAQPVNEAAELVGLLTILAGLFTPVFPSLAKIYTPATVQGLADAAVPVMNKHGWTTGEFLGKWAAELALAAVGVPVVIATARGVLEDIAAAKATEKAAPAQAITKGAEVVPVALEQPQFAARG